MILKPNTQFEGYTLTRQMGKSTPYREMFHAVNEGGQDVALIVYDMNKLPECYNGIVPELELIPVLSQDVFPKFQDKGFVNNETTSLRWVATQYINGTSLTECIEQDRPFPVNESLEKFYGILVAVKEISWRLNRGSHNNINTDNIIVSTDEYGNEKWYLVGLNCVSEPCRGKASFDATMRQFEFCAPETAVGIYKQASDIFSLGIVLSYILQHKHPWPDIHKMIKAINSLTVAKHFITTNPIIETDSSLMEIVKNAIATKQSERYQSLEELGTAIAEYLGNEDMKVFECFGASPSTVVATPDKENNKDVEDESEVTMQQTAGKPKANVKIGKVKGEGFKSVAGMSELKSKLTRNFIDIVKNKELARQFQITPPNGILLWGPPGTGKTYISRRLGEEAGLLYTLVQPSDLGSIYIHGSQSMIADLFSKAEQQAKESNCGVLLVFDEFDSLVPKRGNNDDNNQANEVAEFLTQLNNCAEKGVYVIATTNRLDAIDQAVTRKGRLDEIIYIGLPDEDARKELIELELANRPHEVVDTRHLAQLTKGYTSSDIAFIIKECARCSFEESLKSKSLIKITQELIERTISTTRASVSEEELKQYERTRDSFMRVKKEERRRIGFNA